MAAAHAAVGYDHHGSVDVVWERSSPDESLHVSSVLRAGSSGCQNLCPWKPGSLKPDLGKGDSMIRETRLFLWVCNWPQMAQPLLLLLAVLSAGGQSSVGPPDCLLWEAAALRLGFALGLQREPFQSMHVMTHVILRSRRQSRPRRRRGRQRRHQCDPASDEPLLLRLPASDEPLLLRLLPLCPE